MLAHAEGQSLIDPYAIYQHLMDYWAATMQDDCYLISADGWVAKTARILETDKKGTAKDKGWTCDLVPKPLVVARFFAEEQAAIDVLQAELEVITSEITELSEEHGGEDGVLKDVSSKTDAELAYNQTIVALWNDEDKPDCAKYRALIDAADGHASHLIELSNKHHFSGLKNSKGKFTPQGRERSPHESFYGTSRRRWNGS